MTLENRLAGLLLSDPAIRVMVGDNVDWNRSSQGVTGARIIMFVISSPVVYRMKGPVQHFMTRVQIDCRGETDKEARGLGEAVDALLSGYKGSFGGIVIDGVFRDGIQSATERDTTVAHTAIQWFARKLDYRFYWAPAQP